MEEEPELQRRATQRQRQRRNAFFIPSVGGGLDSESEGAPCSSSPAVSPKYCPHADFFSD